MVDNNNKIVFCCKEGSCLLQRIYPNSDASLACDENCYLVDPIENQKYVEHYKTKFSKSFNEIIIEKKI